MSSVFKRCCSRKPSDKRRKSKQRTDGRNSKPCPSNETVAPKHLKEKNSKSGRRVSRHQQSPRKPMRPSSLVNCDPIALEVFNLLKESVPQRSGKRRKRKEHPSRGYLASNRDLIRALCRSAADLLEHEKRVLDIKGPVQVFGDIHGNLEDLLTFQRTFWKDIPRGSEASYLFLGDYVDRGANGVEVACYLFALKLLAPKKVNLLRGNHEDRGIQKKYSFYKECLQKFGSREGEGVFEDINEVFDRLPLAAVIDSSVFCSHGGIPTSTLRVKDILEVPCPLVDIEIESAIAWELLWNDPFDAKNNKVPQKSRAPTGFYANKSRDTAFLFTEKAVDRFLVTNDLTSILRAHEVVPMGFKHHFKGKVTTVFSSSHYNGDNNKAASVRVEGQTLEVYKIDT